MHLNPEEHVMKKTYLITLFIAGIVILFACVQTKATRTSKPAQAEPAQEEITKHMEVDFTQSCTECHELMTPDIFASWQASKHGQTNVKCYVCHGDGMIEFYPTGSDTRCIGCHSQKEVDFSEIPVDRCFDCHGGHTLIFHQN
jgi:hypothetical protein